MTLVTAKTQKLLYTCVCTRAREDSRTSHFTFLNTYFSVPLSSYKFSNTHPTISPLSNAFSFFFYFPQNDKSLFTKRQVTFHKTTGYISQNDKSLFIKRRVVFSPKQDTRCTTIKLTDICSVDKSVHCVTHFFQKKDNFTLPEKNIISIFAPHIHILKHFSYGC